jgi:cyclic pyranopterin phosphate synthase
MAPEGKVRRAIRFLHGTGIRKVRFTGGEPTLYKNLCGLVEFAKSIDCSIHTAITSNGILLESLAASLSGAGLDSANISIDTLDPVKFHRLTGRSCLKSVIRGIDAAAGQIGRVKLNCVLIRGFNDNEAGKLIAFANDRRLDIRFIEFMPNRYSAPGDPRYISSQEILDRLPWALRPLTDRSHSAARYYSSPSLDIKVGFISSVSRPFCRGCNRVRLTADGLLHTCLYDSNNINLFELIEAEPEIVLSEYRKLIKLKQPGGCRTCADSDITLPSFSAFGG